MRAKVPGIDATLSVEIVHFVQSLRQQDLFKAPGVAEPSIGPRRWLASMWWRSILRPSPIASACCLAHQDDIARIEGTAKELLEELRANLRAAE